MFRGGFRGCLGEDLGGVWGLNQLGFRNSSCA